MMSSCEYFLSWCGGGRVQIEGELHEEGSPRTLRPVEVVNGRVGEVVDLERGRECGQGAFANVSEADVLGELTRREQLVSAASEALPSAKELMHVEGLEAEFHAVSWGSHLVSAQPQRAA